MEYLIGLIQRPVSAIAMLGVLIFVHELGHFLVAKLCKVGVLEFALGFGKKLITKKHGDTTYSIRLIPLGGFVKMVGDDPRFRSGALDPEEEEQLSEEERRLLSDKSKRFLEKNYFQKIAIVFAGPLFNILFALILTIGARWHYGEMQPVDLPKIARVQEGLPAAKAGIKPGDYVNAIDGKEIKTWIELATIISTSEGRELTLDVKRASEMLQIKIAAMADENDEAVLDGKKPPFRIGIAPDSYFTPITFGEAVVSSTQVIYRLTGLVIKGIVGMASGLVSPKNIGGPILIFKEAASSASKGFDHVIQFMVFLSISLAVLNLLPIPILDGGHIVMFTIEAIRRKPLGIRFYEIANQIGMFILLSLMIFAFSNDIGRFLGQ